MVYVPIRAINNSHEVPPELPEPVLNVHLDHYITGLPVMEEIPLNLRLNISKIFLFLHFTNYFRVHTKKTVNILYRPNSYNVMSLT